jgi:two-component system sensor histidine kinase KdpD
VNATTIGFGYLLLILVIATTWGFVESLVCSILATLAFNFFFLEPVGTLTISDPQNWVAMFSFLTTAVMASRLSDRAKRRTLEAVERKTDVERLYSFSRAILLIDGGEPFPKQLLHRLAEIFELKAAVLYDRRSGEFYRDGPADFEGMDTQLRDAALQGTSFSDPERNRVIAAVRLGAEPIASLAVQGAQTPDAVLQGIANLVAIGLERARAQDLAHQVEAARQSEQLRTTLIDAMAHEFKTPLTSIKAATTSLLADPGQTEATKAELVQIADEEARHLEELIDNAVEMARLDTARIRVHPELSRLDEIVRSVAASVRSGIGGAPIEVVSDGHVPPLGFDQRLIRLAIKQLLDNALKYSPSATAVTLEIRSDDRTASVDVIDHGKGIPPAEQSRIFERFYRSPSVKEQVPGSGLGLSIAHRIAQAHGGDLNVSSRPGETRFRLTLPLNLEGDRR